MKMFARSVLVLVCGLMVSSPALSAGGEDPDWYYPEWLARAAHAPRFEVRDTVNKYGRYATKTKTITLKDLIKFHGHFCGGLVESAAALRLAFDRLFPNEPIDRTDLRIASNNSACGGDVAAYLTGARVRFGSHYIDSSLTESEFVVQRLSTGASVRVRIRTAAYPTEVRALARKIESGNFTPADIDRFQKVQWDYAQRLVTRPLTESVEFVVSQTYAWPELSCKDFSRRKDNDYKRVPQAR